MSNTDDRSSDAELETMFAAARTEYVKPSDALLDRIVADAADWQPLDRTADQPGLLTRCLDALGGWPAVGGLATATVAGLYIGFAQPELLDMNTLVDDDAEFGLSAILPDDTLFFEEG